MSDADVELIVAKRHANGGDYWASEDGRIYVGNPFSALSCLGMLHELDVDDSHEAVAGALGLVLDACRDDGRIRLGPKSPLYPCYTAEAARMLCRYGLREHESVLRTVDYLLGAVHDDGGWRCNFTRFGRGPETECSNPGATLYALDVLRHYPELREGHAVADGAVATLLEHWESREPRGPCHWGIGTLFLQVEYPFYRYNLFFWVYVLSFFRAAVRDHRFRAAYEELASRRDADGRMIVERPHRNLAKLDFCSRGEPSRPATRRFREIEGNVG